MSFLSFPIISLFLSLFGIIILFGQKNMRIERAEHQITDYPSFNTEDLQKTKKFLKRGARQVGYIALFISIKIFLKSSNFLKKKGQQTFEKIKKVVSRKSVVLKNNTTATKEVSKYLSTISEYREKIRKIKHRIKEEEGL